MKKLLFILLFAPCFIQAQSNLQSIKNKFGIWHSRPYYYNGSSWIALGDSSAAGGSMVYPGAGIAVSTGSAWGTSITDNSTNWNTVLNRLLLSDSAAMLSNYLRKNNTNIYPLF